jgi:hypothetical protein
MSRQELLSLLALPLAPLLRSSETGESSHATDTAVQLGPGTFIVQEDGGIYVSATGRVRIEGCAFYGCEARTPPSSSLESKRQG